MMGRKVFLVTMQCICCGTCCSKYQPRLSLAEAQLLAQKLGISWEQFKDNYTDSRWPGTASFLLRHQNGACIFLQFSPSSKQKLCLIHDFKPECCLDWQAGWEKPECRGGLQNTWQLTVDSAGRVCGDPERVEEFEAEISNQK
jgi:Fe-S-cluster containining protein